MASGSSFSPLQTAQANHYLFRPLFQRVLHLLLWLWKNWSTFAERLSICLAFFHSFALRRFVDDHEIGDVSVSLFTVCVRLLMYLFVDTGAVLLSTRLYLEIAARNEHESLWDRAFSGNDRGQAIGHLMHGNLLGLPVRSVRHLVFHTRSFDRVRRLLRCLPLECLRTEQQHN